MKTILTILLLLNVELISQIKFIGNPGLYEYRFTRLTQHQTFHNIMYAMGNDGTFYRTNNFGDNVELSELPMLAKDIKLYTHPSDSNLIYFLEPYSLGKLRLYGSEDKGATVNLLISDITSDNIAWNSKNINQLYIAKNNNELWRSNDRGRNWVKIYSFERKAYSIAISETDTSLVYAAILNGLRRSTDGGYTWEAIYDTIGGYIYEFTDIKIHPASNNIVYTNTFHLYKYSLNTKKMITITDFGPSHGISGYAIDPIDTNIIFISGSNPQFPGEIIFQSIDEGSTWVSISNSIPTNRKFKSMNILLDYRNRNTLYADVYEGGIVKSTDGGISWSRTNFVHDRAFKMDFGNSNRIFTVGSPWGLMKTDNDGETWDLADIVPDSLLYKKPEYVAINPFNRNEGFLTINYKLLKTTNGGNSFVQQSANEGWTWIMYNPHFQNILYGIIMPGYSTEYGVFKSTDGGLSWNLNSLFANPKSFSPKNENKLYTYGIDSWGIGVLYVSQNGGSSWTNNISGLRKYSGSTDPLPVSAVIESYHDSNIVYCGQWGDGMGSISKSTNGGESWFQIDASFPEQNKYVHCMLLDKNKPGRFYVGAQSGLYLTENDGQTWRKLFNKNVYDLMMDSSQPPNIYLNTHAGVLKLVDTVTVDVKEKSISQPETFALYQNYPNPFNPVTTIRYQIPKAGRVTLKVYDILGKGIATLVNEEKETGRYTVNFDASALSSGVYFYELAANDYRAVKKLIVIK